MESLVALRKQLNQGKGLQERIAMRNRSESGTVDGLVL